MPRRGAMWAVTVGGDGEPCPRCGGRDWEVVRPGFWPAVGTWLRTGGPFRRPRRRCRSCGLDSTGRYGVIMGRVSTAWWRAPWDILQIVRAERNWEPVPVTYVMAIALGLVLGIGAQIAFGWPWWLVLGVVVVGTWLVFMASAFAGRELRLGEQIGDRLRPRRAHRRRVALLHRDLEHVPVPLLGLDDRWQGPRLLGAPLGDDTGQVTGGSLIHGDVRAEGPLAVIRVWRAGRGDEPARRRQLAEELWHRVVPPPSPAGSAEDQVRSTRERHAEIAARPDPAWQSAQLLVDGRPLTFATLSERGWWVAMHETGEREIQLAVRGLSPPDVGLATVTDLGPYLAGSLDAYP